jgi:transposase-like protein
MLSCPVCGSTAVRVWIHSRFHDTSCNDCGSTWQQVGSEQWGVRPSKDRLVDALSVAAEARGA